MKNKINFLPKPKHFLIAAEGTTKTAGGIFIPETAADAVGAVLFSRPQQVLAPNPDCEFLKEGDWIMLEPSPVDLIEVDEVGYFLVAEYRVRGKILNYTPKPIEPKSSIIIN